MNEPMGWLVRRASRGGSLSLLLFVSVWLGLSGCGSAVPPLAAGPFALNDPDVMERALNVVRGRGYHPDSVDWEAGTFVVVARSEPRFVVTFLVRCTSDGWVVVVPRGDRVVESPAGYRMTRRTDAEYRAFVSALDREMHAIAGMRAPGAP